MLNEQQVVELLAKAGNKGMTCKKLAKHLYNANNSLFETASLANIYRDLQAYLNKKAKMRVPYIEKTEQWGYYRLNEENLKAHEGWLADDKDEVSPKEETKAIEASRFPSLFD